MRIVFVWFAGVVVRRGHPAGIQAAVAEDPWVDDPALLAVQGCLGLDHPHPGHVHGHLHPLRGCIPAQRAGVQPEAVQVQQVWRRSTCHH